MLLKCLLSLEQNDFTLVAFNSLAFILLECLHWILFTLWISKLRINSTLYC